MKNIKLKLALLTAAGAGIAAVLPAVADVPTTAPTTAPAVVSARSAETIAAEVQKTLDTVKESLLDPDALLDPAKRKEVAPRIVPPMQKIVADLNELAGLDPEHKSDIERGRNEYLTFLAACGDEAAGKSIQKMVDSKDPATATSGRAQQLTVKWIESAKDEKSQAKVVDDLDKLAKAHPESEDLSGQLLTLAQFGPASPELGERVVTIVTDDMKNDVATQMGAQVKEEMAATRKLASLEGKPLVITGTDLNGKPFSTADWKGKVILVDFWATWCGPCRAELPRVEKLYTSNHAKGLEVLGVSNDQTVDDLKGFLDKDKAMAWPQLFDAAAAKDGKWNPITTGFGINGIPTMFLIDKKGVVRTVNARESMEDLIPKMLAE